MNTVASNPSAVELFERAATEAASVVECVSAEQLMLPTPCSEWNVRALIEHMAAGPVYLLEATAAEPARAPTVGEYRAGVAAALAALERPGALECRCMSPLGFEWSVAEATAGTFMDQLVHTWDLAVATGQDASLDPELVDVCIAMFLPHMPEAGRAQGLVGPEVAVASDASPQARLVAAMGRTP